MAIEAPKTASRGDWLNHPYTQHCADVFERNQLEQAHQQLIRAAESTSDPRVAAALARYKGWKEFVDFMATKTLEVDGDE